MTELGNVNYSYYIPNDTNIAKYNKMPSFKDYFNDSHDSFEKTTISNATDSNDDGKISYEEKIKCFVKGLVSPITSMFSSPKNFITGAAMILGGAALIAATGGAAAPLLVAAGVLTGGLQIGKGLYKASTAQTDEEAKEAWNEMGSGTSFVGLSVLGAKSSVAQAETAGVKVSPNAKNLNAFEATIECFKSVPSSISKSFSEITNNSGKNFSEFFSKVGVTDKKSKPKVNSDEKPDSKPQNSSNNAGSQERKVPPEKPNNAGGQERKIVPEKPNNAGGQERKVNSKKTLDSSDSTREVKDTSESNNLQKGDEQKQQVTEQELTLEQEKSKRLEAGLKNMERTGVYNGPESGVMYLPEEKISNILEKNTVTNTQDIITNGKEDIRPTNSNDAPVPYDDIKADIDAMFAESAKTRQEQENLIVKPTDKKVKAVEQPKLSIEQQDAIKDYQDEFSVNTKLRNGKALDNPLYKDQIKLIDEAIDNSNPLTDEATVYRSVHTKNSKGKEYEFWTKLKKDGQMTDPAYMSTGKSWSDNTSQFIDNGVTNGETYTLRIKLPKGTKGIDVGQRVWDGVSSGYGDEFLLPRNSTIKLNSIDEANKLAECEYVLPDMSKAEL